MTSWPGSLHAAGDQIHPHVRYAHLPYSLVGLRASQDGLDARSELGERERLGKIVVPSGLEPADPLIGRRKRAQNDNRSLATQ